jgi:hypothetical protein
VKVRKIIALNKEIEIPANSLNTFYLRKQFGRLITLIRLKTYLQIVRDILRRFSEPLGETKAGKRDVAHLRARRRREAYRNIRNVLFEICRKCDSDIVNYSHEHLTFF